MDKKTLEKKREELMSKKESLLKAVGLIDKELEFLTNLEKPYVANVSAYSGHYSMQFKTEAQARKKLQEYASKKYFKNGLNYGVYLFKWNEDGSKELLEIIPLGNKNFTVNFN